MNTLRSAAIAAITVLTITRVAEAHPGHGTSDGYALSHYLADPLHIGIGAALVAAVVGVLFWVRRHSAAQRLGSRAPL